jgi:hypothetical protein
MGKKKKKDGRFQLKRAGGSVLKSKNTKKEEVKKQVSHKIKEDIKVKEVIPETKKAIVPIKEESVEEETEIKDHGLSEAEMGLLENVDNILNKKEESSVKTVTGHKTEIVKMGIISAGVENPKDILIKRTTDYSFPELKRNEVIELTPNDRYNIFETVVSRINSFKKKSFIRISNGSIQSKLFSKAIERIYLKEIKYKLKTVPYLYVMRNKEILDINLCSEIIFVNDCAYFVIVEVSNKNKMGEEVQKIILLNTNFILK